MFWGSSYTTKQLPSLEGKVFLITGANSGIGEASARMFALAGASKIYLACRSESRVREALDRIRAWLADAKQWKHCAPASVTPAGVDVDAIMSRLVWLPLDLTSLKSVKEAAETFKAKETRLDCLLNNAGVMAMPLSYTQDGLEMQVGTNVVGHYLLTMLLMPVLADTARLPEYADTGKTVRVVQVSSTGHTFLAKRHIEGGWKDLEAVNRTYRPEALGTWLRYAKSKTGNILLANRVKALAEANQLSISSASIHPGVVRSNLVSGLSLSYGSITGTLFTTILYPFQLTAEAGALTQIYACASTEFDERKENGSYFVPSARVGRAAWYARDESGEAGKDLDAFVEAFVKQKVGVDFRQVLREEGRLSNL
ncbi:hypothetical protein OC834_006695 [Tilletia horrida]|nr:hypothetical protein OC835_007399 [Tilletia horrida]KAK0521368.1 hypothetical protein OC834_006695 [Tilletia horrida]KAK0559379.1 hypothetical protein OC844_004446 [Tilletia horrida]